MSHKFKPSPDIIIDLSSGEGSFNSILCAPHAILILDGSSIPWPNKCIFL